MPQQFIENQFYIAFPATQQINNKLKTKIIDSLGHSGSSLVLPKSSKDNKNKHAFYEFYSFSKGQFNLYVGSIPIHPQCEKKLRYAVIIDNQAPVIVSTYAEFHTTTWNLNVLRNQSLTSSQHIIEKPGKHTIQIYALDEDLYLDQIMIDFKENRNFYTIPCSYYNNPVNSLTEKNPIIENKDLPTKNNMHNFPLHYYFILFLFMVSIIKDLKEPLALPQEWQGFKPGAWTESIDVRDFIQHNYTPYSGNEEFLSGPSQRTLRLWDELKVLLKREIDNGGVLDADEEVVSSITSHKPGYIDKELEVVVGLQTDAPLKRALMPFGGLRMAQQALESYGFKMCEKTADIFKKIRKTHNEGVFDAYTSDIRAARSAGIITGLPDAYGRGRIIGDYRRVALYGTDRLIVERRKDLKNREHSPLTDELIRLREEMSEQIRALEELAQLGASYGCDLTRPAANAREAVQWTYLGYLAAVKEQNGAAMSLGRVSTFFDIYFTRDLEQGLITEEEVQEIIDQFVMKLRIVRFIRTPDYNNLFSGDPTWVTESIGGMGEDGRTLVTRSSFRMLQTLYNLGPAPEPNLTVLWSRNLPEAFKSFCAKVSIETSSVQYENDDLMRPHWGDDYGIACCVSAMRIGKQMQFFGARANLAKCLLYALNGGVDELKGKQVAPPSPRYTEEILNYDEVMALYDKMQDWLAKTYIDALNIIHYMHDKYCYERIEMALHDPEILRTMATGIAGLSVAADSLSAIKYATVKAIRNEEGLIVDFKTEGEFPVTGTMTRAWTT